MKTLTGIAALWMVLSILGTSQALAQAGENYTFITGDRGPQVCVGNWIPPRDVGLPGTCDGQLFGLSQLSALSAKQTVDRLDQLIGILNSVDQRLAVSNERINMLIQATASTQASIDRQVRQGGELLSDTITRRFDALPEEILNNDLFNEEITKLKKDILEEIEKRFSPRPAPAKK
jgi:hypothetical protein